MPLDHTEFIEQQSRLPSDNQKVSAKDKARNIMLSILLLALYIGGCIMLAVVLEVDKVTAVLSGLSFVIAGILGFWLRKAFQRIQFKEKERQLIREVLEGSRGARLITDSADNTVYYNQKMQMLCSGDSGQPTLDSLAAMFMDHLDGYKIFQKLAEQARLGIHESMAMQSGSGAKEQWFQVTAQPVAGWAGYVHWRFDDISEQREVDRSVRQEREKLIDFTDNAPIGFFSVNEEGRFIFVNATLARWLGEDIEKLLAVGTLHTYFERPPIDAAPYDIIEGGGARQVAEVKMKGPAGRNFLANINQAVVSETEGEVRTRGVVHDLTLQREMRKALQASEDKFQRFFDEAPLGIAMIDTKGVLKDYNTALSTLINPEDKNIQEHEFKDFIFEDDRSRFSQAIDSILPGKRMPAPIDMTITSVSGQKFAAQMHARRFKNSDEIALHFIDMSEQKSLEEQFVQSQKMQAVGQLAGGVAHDFNNLLTAIIGFCDLLLLRHKPGDPSFGDIMQIKQNSNRAANLVRQLLAFSRQQTLRPQVHDMAEILSEVSHLLRRLIGANIELDLIHGDDLGMVKIDLGQMEQVLINLAVNARDAMDDGGSLTIETENFDNDAPIHCGDDEMPPGQWVTISVEDTGTGIPKDVITRILEPFFTTKDVGKGTGLGLSTVYGIIRQTNGYLCIKSEEGEGTRFTIYLPRLTDKEALEAQTQTKVVKQKKADDLTGSACILLVEDEDAVRSFSTRALMNKGYEVLGAENGEAALRLLEEESDKNIDLLVTDVMMPDMDGPTLAQRLRQENPELRIIFISGYTEDRLKEHMGKGISFLPKPFTLKQLAEKVKEALEG